MSQLNYGFLGAAVSAERLTAFSAVDALRTSTSERWGADRLAYSGGHLLSVMPRLRNHCFDYIRSSFRFWLGT